MSASGGAPVLHVQRLGKRYGEVSVFSEVTMTLARGEFVALLGESGVGKSTLLNCIAGLDEADSGSVRIEGVDWSTLTPDARALLRRVKLGFVFQAFHVLPHLNVAENVGLPLMLQGRHHGAHDGAAAVGRMLTAVGLAGLEARWPAQLSGGQLQRVALARALVHRPTLILADEPTGNLDPTTAAAMMELLRQQVHEAGAACLLVTHSAAAAAKADRVVRLTPEGVVRLTPNGVVTLTPTGVATPPPGAS